MNSSRPTICLLIDSFCHGGTERQFAQLVTRLNQQKYDVLVGCLDRRGEFYSAVSAAGLPVVEFPLRGWVKPRTLLSGWRWMRLVRRAKISLVHTFDLYTNIFAAPLARLAGAPVVITSLRHETSVCSATQRWALRRAFRWSDCVIVNSEAAGQSLVREEGVPPDRVRVLRNGIDLGLFDLNGRRDLVRQCLTDKRDALLVTVVGNLREEKDHRTLLEAVPAILKRIPQVHFLLVGSGPLEWELRQTVEEKGLHSSVSFLGDRSDVPELLTAADLAVLPTLSESLPNVVLEAMAASRAVVASAVGGCKELIEGGRTGVLVPPRDPVALAEQVACLLEQPARREEMGRAARQRAEAEFGVDTAVARLEGIYDGLLEGKWSNV